MMPSSKPIYPLPLLLLHIYYIWINIWQVFLETAAEINMKLIRALFFVKAGLHLKICYYNKEIFEQ